MSALSVTILIAGCSSDKNKTGIVINDNPFALITIDETSAGDEITLKLSDLTNDFTIIRLEDNDEAFVKCWKTAVSDNYILIIPRAGETAKLFAHDGRYVAEIGKVGNGPGEYSFLYDGMIDEDRGTVYLSQFSGPVYRYDLHGNFINNVDMPVGGKAALAKDAEGGISAVSLSFSDVNPTPIAATISISGELKTTDYPPLNTSMADGEGQNIGFSNEVFSYRCVDNNVFLNTAVDTMYVYDPKGNRIYPRAVLNRANPSDDNEFIMAIELPQGILMGVHSKNNRQLWYDKTTGAVNRTRFINDYLGDNPVGYVNLRDGHYIQCIEPGLLIDRIEEQWLTNPNLDDKRKTKLRELLSTLDPESNDIVFIAPLKKP